MATRKDHGTAQRAINQLNKEEVSEEQVIESAGFAAGPLPLPPPPPDDDSDIIRPEPKYATPVDSGVAGADAHEAETAAVDEMEGLSPQDRMMMRLTLALENLSRRGPNEGDSRAIELLTKAFDRMTAAQLEAGDRVAKATRVASRPSNEVYPSISVFNLRGDKDFPRPQLKCKMHLPWEADWDNMTREEIELCNLLEPGDYMVKRNDGTKIKVSVRATYKLDSDVPDHILVNHETAFNNDYHRLMPYDWVRQMVRSNPRTRALADMILTMEEEEELIKAGKLNDGSTPAKGQRLVSVGE